LWFGNFFPMFLRIATLSSTGLLVRELTHNPKMKAVRFFETSESNYPIMRRTNPEVPVPQLSAGGDLKSLLSY
jgi:hypothetical protein